MHEREFHADEIVVCPLELLVVVFYLFAFHDIIDHVFEFLRVAKPEGVDDVVVQLILAVEHQKELVILFRPCACKYFVLRFKEIFIVHHLEEDVCVHHREAALL